MLSKRIKSWRVCSGISSLHIFSASFEGTALSARISSWHVISVRTWAPDVNTQCTPQFLTCMLSVHISFWCACSLRASVPYVYSEGIQNRPFQIGKLEKLMHMQRCASVPDAHAQCTHDFLTRLLSRIQRSEHVCKEVKNLNNLLSTKNSKKM